MNMNCKYRLPANRVNVTPDGTRFVKLYGTGPRDARVADCLASWDVKPEALFVIEDTLNNGRWSGSLRLMAQFDDELWLLCCFSYDNGPIIATCAAETYVATTGEAAYCAFQIARYNRLRDEALSLLAHYNAEIQKWRQTYNATGNPLPLSIDTASPTD